MGRESGAGVPEGARVEIEAGGEVGVDGKRSLGTS